VKGVEVWYLPTADVCGEELLGACDAILTADERERGRAFVFEKNRHEHLVTRALCRGVLGRALDADPKSLAFRRNEYGRPELSPASDLRFNLTNTVLLVACAVARGHEVGVDAEPATRADDILGVAESVFTTAELDALTALDVGARRERALKLWTAKEAYMKARGMGFSLPPEKFELDVREDGIRLRFLEDLGDTPTRWEITTREIEGHMLATCIERLESGNSDVVVRRANLAELVRCARRPT
jgi:4'-phosphopantetheinyl transferase